MAENYRYIGKTIPRMDGTDVVTGRTQFIDDIPFKHLLYGKVLCSPHPHAVIKNIDTAKAEKIKGVRAVITHENVPDWNFGTPPIRLLDKKVRYVGDAVAIVAAESERIASERKENISEQALCPACVRQYIVLGAVAPYPVRAEAAVEYLTGKYISDETATEAAEKALDGAKPLSKNAYKVQIAKTLVKQAILGVTD